MIARTLRGIGVSPGVAWAPAVLVRTDFPNVPDRYVEPGEIDHEIERFRVAVQKVVGDLQALGQRVLQRAGVEESRIFDAQIMLAQDVEFSAAVEQAIRRSRMSAETAYEFKALEIRELWSSGGAQLRDRLADLHAIQIRTLHELLGKDDELFAVPTDEQVIVVAHELSPGLTVQLDREHVVGLISEEGTRTSHAAILAHSLGIPAVMGVQGALSRVGRGTMVLLDGQSGVIVLDPTRDELEDARTRVSRRHKLEFQLEGVVDQPAVTSEGHRVTLLSNVDLPDEIQAAVRVGAEGVGLLRTEFLLTGRASLPTEDEQAEYFRRVARAFPGKPIVVRSYDLGGDKFPAAFRAPSEANPFLGWRSIRVCLDHPDMFREQLRAILRVAAGHDLRLMLPLVTRVEEVEQTRDLMHEAAESLRRDGIPAAASVPVGVMIETPAAVITADRLAEVSDFFSVGTNDLTQYTMAVDRGNARLADRFTHHHPSVIRQMHAVVQAGREADLAVSVCGEFASEPLGAMLLVGLGYDTLSIAPPAISLVKWAIRTIPEAAARRAAEAALSARTTDEVLAALRESAAPYVDLRLLDPSALLPGRSSGASLPPDGLTP